MISELLDFLKNKKILILGFGLEGQSTYKFIRKHFPDKKLTISDLEKDFYKKYGFLKTDLNLEYICGEEYLDHFSEFDLIMKSPGISFKNLDVEKYRDKISSQLQLSLDFFDVYTIGITGTKGKSTTSSLIHEILLDQNIENLFLGNIGVPILECAEDIKVGMKIILEMSSHQLEYMTKSPNLSILLNIYEEHLDHYGSFEEYIGAKFNIARYQKENDYFLYNLDNENIRKCMEKEKNIISKQFVIQNNYDESLDKGVYKKEEYIYIKDKKEPQEVYDIYSQRNLVGDHNLTNIMFVLAVSHILQLDNTKTIETINQFKPLTHRMEFVGKYDGVYYYNDSIATIPEATMNCVNSLENVDTLIIGGLDRGVDFTDFIEYLRSGVVRNLICMPTTGHMIGRAIEAEGNTNVKIEIVDTLEEAVKIAKEITQKEKICLLSPAAASYEYFKNYKEKGDRFKRLVSSTLNVTNIVV